MFVFLAMFIQPGVCFGASNITVVLHYPLFHRAHCHPDIEQSAGAHQDVYTSRAVTIGVFVKGPGEISWEFDCSALDGLGAYHTGTTFVVSSDRGKIPEGPDWSSL